MKALTQAWPRASRQVRAMTVWQGLPLFGIGSAPVAHPAQVWKLDGSQMVMHSWFDQDKTGVLFAAPDDHLYIGVGTPHSAEGGNNTGQAKLWRYDANGCAELIEHFTGMDVVYSLEWHDGAVHCGLMAENLPGSAKVFRVNGPGSVSLVGVAGANGWPVGKSWSAAYELLSFCGDLYCGTFGKAQADGTVLRYRGGAWQELGGIGSPVALALSQYPIDGVNRLVAAFSRVGASAHPIQYLDDSDQWRPLGEVPQEWADTGAYIFNHMVSASNGRLYVGVGGTPGSLSVWSWDGLTWCKEPAGWVGTRTAAAGQWIYRMMEHDGVLYIGMAGDDSEAPSDVWCLPLPTPST